jgi:hypothetical protein
MMNSTLSFLAGAAASARDVRARRRKLQIVRIMAGSSTVNDRKNQT